MQLRKLQRIGLILVSGIVRKQIYRKKVSEQKAWAYAHAFCMGIVLKTYNELLKG